MKILQVFTIPATPESFFDGQFRYLTEQGHELHLACTEGADKDFLKRNCLTYHPVDIARRIDPLADLKTIRALYKLIDREGFECVVGHTPKGAMVAMIAAFLCGVKMRIYFRHGLIYTTAHGLKRMVLKTVEQLTSLLANKIINVSPSLSELAVKDHLNGRRKQSIIGRGTCGGIDTVNLFNPKSVDAEKLDTLRSKLGIESHDKVIGFVGRICKEKGIRELIDGYTLFHKTNQETKLLLIGGYDTRDILPEDYKRIIETENCIISTGNIDKKDLPYYYSLMDIFVFPSYREGFGMCVIEAGAMGIPALVSRSHGCVDSIEPGITGDYLNIDASDIARVFDDYFTIGESKYDSKEIRRHVVAKFEQTNLWPLISMIYQYSRK